MRIDHVATCPEVDPVLCAELDIPVHEHHQGIDWLRAEAAVNLGLGRSWQAALSLPIDLRLLAIDYSTLDGESYDPPYGDTHHRDEVLWGPTDGQLALWRYTAPAERLILGLGAGATLPLGRTEADPFALAAQGLAHQHFQLGSGTFDPLLSGRAVLAGSRWGGWASVDARLPLYANREGYRPPRSVSASLGPTFKLIPPLQLVPTADFLHETPETWAGEPTGGRQVLTASLATLGTLSPKVVVQLSGRATAWRRPLGDNQDEPLKQSLILSAGLSWTP